MTGKEGLICSINSTGLLLMDFEDGSPAKESRWNLEARNGCQLAASKQTGISVLQMQEIELCQDPNNLGNGFKT